MATDRTTPEFKAKRAAYFRRWYNQQHWPKCGKCQCIARRFPDIGCLNCYAIKQPRHRKWTEQERDLIEKYAGKEIASRLQYRLYQETGNARTRYAIKRQIREMGITSLTHQDGYTASELARLTGLQYGAVKKMIRRGDITSIGNDNRILVSIEDGDRLIRLYTESHYPSYRMKEACKKIGVGVCSIKYGISKGLPSYSIGRRVYVCKATIDQVIEHLKLTGDTRIPWSRFTR